MLSNIIKTEWLKVKNYRTFWVLLGLFIVLAVGVNELTIVIMKLVKEKSGNLFNPTLFDFPEVWKSVALIQSYVTLILGLLVIILVSNEYGFRTHRQNVIDGWSRESVVVSRISWVVGLSVFATVVCFLTGVIFAVIYGERGFSLEHGQYLIYYFLQCLISLSVALLISVLVKRAGLGIVLYLAYLFLENTAMAIMTTKGVRWGRLLPLETADRLLGFPFVDKLIPDPNAYSDTVYLVMLLIYIVAIQFFTARRFLKADL